jgi:signal recognition particle subunit SRP54
VFESIVASLGRAFDKLRRPGVLTERHIREGMRDIRLALLEADVNYKVVRDFTDRVTEKALGQEVLRSVTPAQQIVKVVRDEIEALMSPADPTIPFSSSGPTVLMLAGLQGSGKTTTCAKLALYLKKRDRRPLLVAADVKRPAAVEQLRVLGEQVGIPVHIEDSRDAIRIPRGALSFAGLHQHDALVLDTAGRLHIDEEMMGELVALALAIKPHQTYLVADAMTGQDAVNSAARFNQDLQLDGVILTKLDGDARGGAALSIRAVTGKPIKFVGIGEKLDHFEEFHPDRMANRILGMGDMVGLVEKAQAAIDAEEALKLQEKLRRESLTLDDFLDQLQRVKKIGSLRDILSMMPGMDQRLSGMDVDDQEFVRIEAMIRSMTPEERDFPDTIDVSRRRRIALGSGTSPHEVASLVKQFQQMRRVMKHMASGSWGKVGMGFDARGELAIKVKKRSKRKRDKKKERAKKKRRRR